MQKYRSHKEGSSLQAKHEKMNELRLPTMQGMTGIDGCMSAGGVRHNCCVGRTALLQTAIVCV